MARDDLSLAHTVPSDHSGHSVGATDTAARRAMGHIARTVEVPSESARCASMGWECSTCPEDWERTVSATAPDASYSFTLRDGTPVLVRPIRPEDKALLQQGVAQLSEVSRYRRFMRALTELSDSQLEYLTEIDYVNHMAWGALDLSETPSRGAGVARYVRSEDDPTKAEVAVTVADAYQGRGLGTLLLGVLAQSATQHGIRTFIAYVLHENAPMMRIFFDLGGQAETDGDVLRVEVPVPEDPQDFPNTAAGRSFRAIARKMAARRATRQG
jgi:GNAT superfamily N-acetyltransferase